MNLMLSPEIADAVPLSVEHFIFFDKRRNRREKPIPPWGGNKRARKG